jgi:signal transduction histidine kinase
VRQRILRTTLTLTLGVIVLMAVAMCWGFWVGASASFDERVETQAHRVASAMRTISMQRSQLTADELEPLVPTGHRIELVADEGGDDLTVGQLTGDGPESVEHVDGVGFIHVIDATGDLQRNHWRGAVAIVAFTLVLSAIATVMAIRTSRRLTTPISDLAAHAERLSSGDLRPSGRRYGVAELDQLADAMDASVRRVASLLAEERSLTVDASHQLKTPLTALSLRLEELAHWPDDPAVRAEAAAALEQVERLSLVVDGLLVDRRSPAVARAQVSLRSVVDQQLSEWRPAYDAVTRELVATIEVGEFVTVDPGPIGQVIASLIENSLVHGAGRTTIEVRAPHGATWIEVFDQGAGVSDEIAPHVFDRDVSGAGGTGLGLAAAQDAAVSVGGRIALVRRRPAHFRFFLNSGEDPLAVRPEAEQGSEPDTDNVGGDVVGKR